MAYSKPWQWGANPILPDFIPSNRKITLSLKNSEKKKICAVVYNSATLLANTNIHKRGDRQ
jgi:hypothetical protein